MFNSLQLSHQELQFIKNNQVIEASNSKVALTFSEIQQINEKSEEYFSFEEWEEICSQLSWC